MFGAGFGHDAITELRTGGSNADVLEFGTGVFADFAAAIGADTFFALDADQPITLMGVLLTGLAADDSHFI